LTSLKNKRIILIIILLLLLPIIVLNILSFFLFGNITEIIYIILKNRNNLSFTSESYPTLSEAINYTLTGYSIIVTCIFSYALLKTSVRSHETAESIRDLENNRDKENIRQSALIVYYELLTGFSNIRELYSSVILENEEPSPKKLFFSDDWVKNISLLKDTLNSKEITEIYKIYNRFLTLKSILDSDSNSNRDKLKKELDIEIRLSFESFIPKELLNKELGDITQLIKKEYYFIISKIRIASYHERDISRTKVDNIEKINLNDTKVYEGEISKNQFNGQATVYNEQGLPSFKGNFLNGKFISGFSRGYIESGEILYEIIYEDSFKKSGFLNQFIDNLLQTTPYFNGEFLNEEIFNGNTVQFDKNRQIKYIGEVKSGDYHGVGSYFFNGELRFKGIFNYNEYVRGELNKSNGYYFNGEFKDGRPFNGKVKNYSDTFIKYFNGKLESGKPTKGVGYIFLSDHRGYDMEQIINEEVYWEPDEEYLSQQNEWFEAMEEQMAEEENNIIRSSYYEWQEFVKADWEQGIYKKKEITEKNKKLFYDPNTKI